MQITFTFRARPNDEFEVIRDDGNSASPDFDMTEEGEVLAKQWIEQCVKDKIADLDETRRREAQSARLLNTTIVREAL